MLYGEGELEKDASAILFVFFNAKGNSLCIWTNTNREKSGINFDESI